MSHGRVNPPGWATSAKLTSAQANQLDINISESLDKTTAGDTLSGTVSLAATGIVSADAAGALIRTKTGGRIELGDNDYPTLKTGHTGRTQVRQVDVGQGHINATQFVRNLTASPNIQLVLTGNASSAVSTYDAIIPLDAELINGATLTQVDILLYILTGHGGLPATKPSFTAYRFNKATATASSMGTLTMAPANLAAYENGGAIQTQSISPLTNNTIDKTTYVYYLGINDEHGANWQAGNLYVAAKLTQTITDLRPS